MLGIPTITVFISTFDNCGSLQACYGSATAWNHMHLHTLLLSTVHVTFEKQTYY